MYANNSIALSADFAGDIFRDLIDTADFSFITHQSHLHQKSSNSMGYRF